jgi:hypothetical protein
MKKCQLFLFVLLCAASNMLFAAMDPVSVTTQTGLPQTTTASSSYSIQYQLTNNLPIPVTELNMLPSATNANFTVDTANTTCTSTLNAAQRCVWSGTFTPIAAGSASATVQLAFFHGKNVYNIPTQVTTAESSTWLASGFDVGDTTGIVYKTNNLSEPWSVQTITDDNAAFLSLAHANGVWLAAGGNNTAPARAIFTSTDARTWTASDMADVTSPVIFAVAYGNNTWVAIGRDGDEGLLEVSHDNGKNWSRVVLSTTNISFQSVYYADSTWVVVGESETTAQATTQVTIYTSTDAETWSLNTTPIASAGVEPIQVIHAADKWVLMGKNNDTGELVVYTSDDAISWQAATINPIIKINSEFSRIAYGNGQWIINADQEDASNYFYSSTDATHWSHLQSPDINHFIALNIQYINGVWLMPGVEISSSEESYPALYTSTDLIHWTKSLADETKLGYVLYSVAAD